MANRQLRCSRVWFDCVPAETQQKQETGKGKWESRGPFSHGFTLISASVYLWFVSSLRTRYRNQSQHADPSSAAAARPLLQPGPGTGTLWHLAAAGLTMKAVKGPGRILQQTVTAKWVLFLSPVFPSPECPYLATRKETFHLHSKRARTKVQKDRQHKSWFNKSRAVWVLN